METDPGTAAHLARASSHGWAVRAGGPSITAIARTRDARTALAVVPLLAVFAYWLATAAADWAKRGADWSRGGLLTLLAVGCIVFGSVIGMRTLGSVVVRLDADRLRVATGVGPLRRRWTEARSEVRRAWDEERKARVGWSRVWFVEGRRRHRLSEYLSSRQAEWLAELARLAMIGGASHR